MVHAHQEMIGRTLLDENRLILRTGGVAGTDRLVGIYVHDRLVFLGRAYFRGPVPFRIGIR